MRDNTACNHYGASGYFPARHVMARGDVLQPEAPAPRAARL